MDPGRKEMKKLSRYLLVALLAVSVGFGAAGCAKKPVASDAGAGAATSAGEGGAGMAPAAESLDSSRSGAFADAGKDGGPFSEGRTSAPLLPVYFDFDKSDIRADQVSRIEKNAEYLQRTTGVSIVIEGNCDERGTNEYNMALGERRALAAKKYLVNLGVDANRLTTISFGEEKPLLFGHDEMSWAQNRRDDFVITR